MSENASEPTKLSDKVKKLAVQGVAGTVSLTAAAVIPLVAQRFLAPPTPVAPASTIPAQVQSTTPEQVASPSPVAEQARTDSEERGRDRERRRGRDKPKD